MTTRIRACIVCHDVRRIRARNLCGMCHDRAWRTGRLDDYAPTKVDRMAQVRPLYEAGMPVADIAQQLGCSNYAVHAVVKRLRNENIAPSSVWESLTARLTWQELTALGVLALLVLHLGGTYGAMAALLGLIVLFLALRCFIADHQVEAMVDELRLDVTVAQRARDVAVEARMREQLRTGRWS